MVAVRLLLEDKRCFLQITKKILWAEYVLDWYFVMNFWENEATIPSQQNSSEKLSNFY